MNRVLVVAVIVAGLAGCDIATPKEESVCKDIVKEIVPDPAALRVNGVKRTEGPAGLADLIRLYSTRFDGNIPPGTQDLIDLYRAKDLQVSQTFISLDVTYDGRYGKERENVLCRYLNYDDNKELVSFTMHNQDIDQHKFLDFFLLRKRPAGLDANYRIQ